MKKLVIAYLIAIHALLAIALIKTDLVPRVALRLNLIKPQIPEEESIIPRLREVHSQMDPSVPTGATIFLGDSITMGLATAALAPYTVNYGIGWQRSDQLIKSMDIYKSIERAGRVVITIGTNDLLQGREGGIEVRYKTILEKIPAKTPIVMNSVPPIAIPDFFGRKVDDANVRKAVASAKAVCESDPRCRFVNTYDALTTNGAPTAGIYIDNGIHLSPKGYELWIQAMSAVLKQP